MFINESHLPQVLPPECYFSDEQHEREWSAIFESGWHYVAALDDLPDDGDFITVELLGRPLILWRNGGTVQAMVNVCAHRLSMLTSDPRGNCSRLKCQYHGWEYGTDGQSCHIPDAQSFRPMGNANRSLTKLATETCGNLVFVRLTDDGPTLSEYLGEGQRVLSEMLAGGVRRNLAIDTEVDANWKVLTEIALESYHVACVHRSTFRYTPPAELCQHRFEDRWTSFEVAPPDADQKQKYHPLEAMANRVMGHRFGNRYQHFHFYPNIMVGAKRMFVTLLTVTPLSPRRCRIRYHMFARLGAKQNPLARFVFRQACRFGGKFGRKILDEDLAVLPDVQRGIESPQRPSPGLISVREERIFHFQKHIAEVTGLTENYKGDSQRIVA